jgi:hypothetical protein
VTFVNELHVWRDFVVMAELRLRCYYGRTTDLNMRSCIGTPMSLLNLLITNASSGVVKVITFPGRCNRPVRPAR